MDELLKALLADRQVTRLVLTVIITLLSVMIFRIVKRAKVAKVKPTEPEPAEPEYMHPHQPHFHGGDTALFRHIADNIMYPLAAANDGVDGTDYVEFVVQPDGR